jgi:transposase
MSSRLTRRSLSFLPSAAPATPDLPRILRPATPPLQVIEIDNDSPPPYEAEDELIPTWLFRRRRPNTTRDDRTAIRTLRALNWGIADIARELDLSYQQVYYFINCTAQRLTPRHRNSGRRPAIAPPERQRLAAFVRRNTETRRMTATALAHTLWPDESIGEASVLTALRSMGIGRHLAYRKPPLSERAKQQRLQFALDHINWTYTEWQDIFFTDEAYFALGAGNLREWVWRDRHEAGHPDVINTRTRRTSVMVWAGIHGHHKSPLFFWDRSLHGTITAATYCEYIIPLIVRERVQERRNGIELILQQDNAPAHTAARTRQVLEFYELTTLQWPPYSPDLNPIENVWGAMKAWLARHYPIPSRRTDTIQQAVREAWDAVSQDTVERIIRSLPDRMRAVISARGGHTQW